MRTVLGLIIALHSSILSALLLTDPAHGRHEEALPRYLKPLSLGQDTPAAAAGLGAAGRARGLRGAGRGGGVDLCRSG